MNFCPNLCISIDESLVVLRKSVIPTRIFWFKNAKINFFEEKWELSTVFIKLKFGWLQACLTDMEKHKMLEMLLRADFLCIFEILHFSRISKIIGSTN